MSLSLFFFPPMIFLPWTFSQVLLVKSVLIWGPSGHPVCPWSSRALSCPQSQKEGRSLCIPQGFYYSIMPNTASATVLSLMHFPQLLKYREQRCSSEIVNFSCTLFCTYLVCMHILNVIVLDIYDSLFCKWPRWPLGGNIGFTFKDISNLISKPLSPSI